MEEKLTNKTGEQRYELDEKFCITATQEERFSLLPNGDILHQGIPEDCEDAYKIGNFVFYCDNLYVRAFGSYDGGDLITIPGIIFPNEIEEYSAKQYNEGNHIIVWKCMIIICTPFEVAVYKASLGKIEKLFSEKAIFEYVKIDAESYYEKIVKISYKTVENIDVFFNSDGEEVEISLLSKKQG